MTGKISKIKTICMLVHVCLRDYMIFFTNRMKVTWGFRRDPFGISRWREATPAVRRRGRPSPTIELMFARAPLSSFWQFLSRSINKMRRPKMQVTRLARATWWYTGTREPSKSLREKRTRRKMGGSTGSWTERPQFCLSLGSRSIISWMHQ